MSGTGTGTYTGTPGSGTGTAITKTLKHQMLDDLSAFFNTDEFAASATYTPAGGAATAIKVLFDKEDGAAFGMEGTRLSCLAKTTDVSAAKPKDTMVIGGVTYKILNPPRHDESGISEIDLTID